MKRYVHVVFLMALSFVAGSTFDIRIKSELPQRIQFEPDRPAAVTIEGSLPTLSLLNENSLGELSDQQKAEIVQLVFEIECDYWGISATAPHFDQPMIVNKAEDLLESVISYAYREYQKSTVTLWREIKKEYRNMLLFRDARELYKESRLPRSTYSFTEIDARWHTEERIHLYLNQIAAYVFKHEKDKLFGPAYP